MKKILTLALLVAASYVSYGQKNFPWLSNNDDTLYLSEKVKFVAGEDLRVGSGSTDDGSFKYIRISSASWMHYSSNSANSRGANQANSLPVSFSGLKMHIKKVKVVGNDKRGYIPYLLLGGGTMTNYECDIANAIKFGEVVCEGCESMQNNKGTAVVVQNQTSVADELIKLKKLKDDGVLTEEEYQAQKKKVLEKQ